MINKSGALDDDGIIELDMRVSHGSAALLHFGLAVLCSSSLVLPPISSFFADQHEEGGGESAACSKDEARGCPRGEGGALLQGRR